MTSPASVTLAVGPLQSTSVTHFSISYAGQGLNTGASSIGALTLSDFGSSWSQSTIATLSMYPSYPPSVSMSCCVTVYIPVNVQVSPTSSTLSLFSDSTGPARSISESVTTTFVRSTSPVLVTTIEYVITSPASFTLAAGPLESTSMIDFSISYA
ncbi:hypothetical protein DSECCO2_637500 [anaerobic digester metagenome]